MFLLLLLHLFVLVDAEEKEYPVGGLKCMYTLKRGTNGGDEEERHVICPEGQDKYCVKQEIERLDRSECGQTEYFGDEYEPDPVKKCLFRKCASECVQGTDDRVHSRILEEFREEKTYTRRTFCCQSDYCNAAAPQSFNSLPFGILLFVVSLLLLR